MRDKGQHPSAIDRRGRRLGTGTLAGGSLEFVQPRRRAGDERDALTLDTDIGELSIAEPGELAAGPALLEQDREVRAKMREKVHPSISDVTGVSGTGCPQRPGGCYEPRRTRPPP